MMADQSKPPRRKLTRKPVPASESRRSADELRVLHLLRQARRGKVAEVEAELRRRLAVRQRLAEHLGLGGDNVKGIMKRLAELA
jgi:hypothetical protein